MKKLVYIFLTTGVVLFSSCEKDLDQLPISNASTETFYKTNNDFIQGINAVYNSLRGYPDRQLNLSETRSDNLYAVSDGGVRDWEGINSFHKGISSNPYVIEAWGANFTGIYRANILLDQLSKNGNLISDENLKKRLEAEARFLRAFFYFDLVRFFGKVPLIDKVVLASEALSIPRSPVADIYNLIISDLEFAGNNLPSPEAYAAADKGRATKYAAKTLLALVYMTRSGPTYNIEGPGLNANEWSKASDLLTEVILSGKYSFSANYQNIFSYTNENNGEVVFDVQYISGFSPVMGATFPWVLVPDTWFQSNGKATQGGLTIRPVSNNILASYENGDNRKAFSIQTGYIYNNVVETQSFFKKYVDLTKVPSNRLDWPINFIVFRYTDVLLLKAECVLHGAPGSQTTDVDNIVNQVRQRAGLTNPVSNVTLSRLMEERRKEFAAEGLRWHDLVRSGLVTSIIPAWIALDDIKGQIQPFIKGYAIYPVPQDQMDIKPGLYSQNSDY